MDWVSLYWPGIVCMTFAIALMFAELTEALTYQRLLKPVAAFFFVLQAVILGAMESVYGALILCGLLACMLGDILLLSRHSKKLFLGGMGAFAVGHVFYIIALASTDINLPRAFLQLAAVAFFAVLGVSKWLDQYVPKGMHIAVMLYSVIIISMVMSAFGVTYSDGVWIVLIAAGMFAVSDIFVARDRFVKNSPLNAVMITPLYFGAQVLFAISTQSFA